MGEEGQKGLPIVGMAKDWERCDAIRSHLRVEGAVIFPKDWTENVKRACVPWIHSYLKTLLLQMASTEGRPQPFVDPLRHELVNLYESLGRRVEDEQVIHESWMTRKFLGLVKMKVRKHMPSTDPCLCITWYFWVGSFCLVFIYFRKR